MRYLKTNTATRVTVGPFLDKTDGITAETGLTVTNCHLTLMVDTGGVPTLALDADATASGGNNDMVHVTNDDAGFYDLELTAANTNYLGRAILSINDVANHCPVFHEFEILPANVYDSLVLGTDLLDANASQLGGTSQTGRDVGASVLLSSGTGTGQLSLSSGTVTLADGAHGGSSASMELGEGLDIDSSTAAGMSVQGATTAFAILNDHATLGALHISNAGAGPDASIPAMTTNITGNLSGSVGSLTTWHASVTDWTDGNRLDLILDAIVADTNELQTDDYPARFTGIEGATFSTATDSLEAIRDRGDAAWLTGAGGSAPTVEQIRTEMDSNSTQLAAIVADTNELQTDWTNSGRLDTILDAILDDTDLIDDGTSGLAKIATDVAAILVDTGTTIPGTITTMQGNVTDILADTNELQGDWANAGRLDTILDAILDDTDLIDDGTSGLAKIATDVAAILVDTGTTIPATLATAQTDLDTITGSDGVTLATTQSNYAPATAAALSTHDGKIDTLDTLVDRLAPLLVGTVTGAGTGTEVYVYGGVTATVSVDASGNVSGVVFS